MNKSFGSPDSDPDTSPRYQRAAIQVVALSTHTGRAWLAAAVFLIASWATGAFTPASIWPTFFGCNAAALMLFATGLRSAIEVSDWRRRKAGLSSLPAPAWAQHLRNLLLRPWNTTEPGDGSSQDRVERLSGKIAMLAAASINRLGARAASLAALAIFSMLVAFDNLSWVAQPLFLGPMAYTISGLCLVVAFGLLVVERGFAAADADEWPEAQSLMLLARLPIVTLSLSAFSLLLAGSGYLWAIKVPALLACLSILVALEFLVRAVVAMFGPQSDERPPQLLAESLFAGILRWPPRPLTALQAELRSRHGIDLRQIWALTFIGRTFPAVALAIAVVGWLLSGVTAVPMSGRGIYERFGRPIAVIHPGLHVGLPWPFGRTVAVENGIVHELATSVVSDGSDPSPPDAEGPAPASANRLWDGTHISEKSQIIASRSEGKQSFQIVNMDVRFVYRIGLSDRAALDAAYHTADIPALMEATASRVLVQDFAGRTLDDVLGSGRLEMADEIATAIRTDLDRLQSGIEVLAVVVEAIHPPAGAANAYHAVQAAEITAQALVARERGFAAQSANEAQRIASLGRDKATATARESVAAADVARLRFEAEQTAYRNVGQVFLDEAYFTQLTSGLGQAKALILDHRIGGLMAPTIDLRSMTMPIDPDAAPKASAPAGNDEVEP
ncbi:protease modulator HflK [Rhizobium tumorigenes]|uniref:Protease modulator HflK n=1 Tax=Rhizobium tumorigenes TaxID=2041385 RepID=A0AAF1KTU7_9HYPH|nr:protease modulator HflK [Rhizobium tumorigenes]WFR99368.1 protease modulator HflK [Rhizobium tumorigenes]